MGQHLVAPTVVLADRSALVRDMVTAVCARYGLSVVGHAATTWELLATCQTHHPTVVVTDATLDDRPIESCLPDVLGCGARVVILSDDASPQRLTTLLESGVSGYLLHDSAPDQVGEALVAVAAGAAVLHPLVTATVLGQWRRMRTGGSRVASAPRSALTPREMEVLVAMTDGLATKAIAIRLGMAPKTVENHKLRIFDKLNVTSHAQAVTVAINDSLLVS